MTGDRPSHPTATEPPPSDEDVAKLEAPVDGPEAAAPGPEAADPAEAATEAPTEEPVAEAVPEAPKEEPVADAVPEAPEEEPAAEAARDTPATPPEMAAPGETDAVGEAAQASTPDAAPTAMEAAAKTAPVPKGAPKPKRAPKPREPLPWPELRAAATMAREDAGVEDLKELFRALPEDVRGETVEGVREYRKGARRPVSAYAGKSLARAVHTSRRARRRPDSDGAVSDAIGQALAAEIIASLDVEVAAEVILPKRDLLERESKNARRRQKAEDDKTRDEKRRRAREESNLQGTKDGSYSGAKIRGLDELAKLFGEEKKDD